MKIKIEFKAKTLAMTKSYFIWIKGRLCRTLTNPCWTWVESVLRAGLVFLNGHLFFCTNAGGRHVALLKALRAFWIIHSSSCSHPRALVLLPNLSTTRKATFLYSSINSGWREQSRALAVISIQVVSSLRFSTGAWRRNSKYLRVSFAWLGPQGIYFPLEQSVGRKDRTCVPLFKYYLFLSIYVEIVSIVQITQIFKE